ncbi:fructose-1,6-bisphosphate aldolase, partial [Marinomonas agarivorans]
TDLRLAATGAIRRSLAEHKGNFDPRKYLTESIKALKSVCIDRYEAFSCAGQASRIKTIDLEEMAVSYERGEYMHGRNF